MKRLTVPHAVAAVVAVAGVSSGSSSVQACKPGVKRIGKTLYRTFCGPAWAVAMVGGKSRVQPGRKPDARNVLRQARRLPRVGQGVAPLPVSPLDSALAEAFP